MSRLLVDSSATGGAQGWNGGRAHFVAIGTWDGATVQIQYAPPWSPNVWIDLTNVSFTANGVVTNVPIGEGFIRAQVTSAGASTSVTLDVSRCDR